MGIVNDMIYNSAEQFKNDKNIFPKSLYYIFRQIILVIKMQKHDTHYWKVVDVASSLPVHQSFEG
jgi:hypothetical protein